MCLVCNLGTVEDELHFLFHCPLYDTFPVQEIPDKRPNFLRVFFQVDMLYSSLTSETYTFVLSQLSQSPF